MFVVQLDHPLWASLFTFINIGFVSVLVRKKKERISRGCCPCSRNMAYRTRSLLVPWGDHRGLLLIILQKVSGRIKVDPEWRCFLCSCRLATSMSQVPSPFAKDSGPIQQGRGTIHAAHTKTMIRAIFKSLEATFVIYNVNSPLHRCCPYVSATMIHPREM